MEITKTKKKLLAIVALAAILLTLGFSTVLAQNQSMDPLVGRILLAGESTPANPPVSAKADAVWGDVTFTNASTYSNMEIILNGDLIVASGGSLTLTNVTLRVNCTSNGSNIIEVQWGGALYINDTDGDPSTRGDATNITALNPDYRFLFRVRSGATFQMNNSELHHCGYSYSYPYTSAGLWINTNNTHVENNTLTNNHYGIILYQAYHNTIKNNTAANNSGYGFWLYYSSNNTVSGNTATNNGYDGFDLSGSNNTVSGNTATNNDRYGFDLSGSNNTISGNTATNNDRYGFWLYGSNNTISGNTATNNDRYGFWLYGSNNTVSGNTATNNDRYGFWLDSSSNSTLSGNTATNNGDHGFELDYLLNNTLSNNTATNNSYCGFHLYNSLNNTLSNNTATNNGDDGFALSNSNNNTISDNTAANNRGVGFYLYCSDGNVVSGNNATYNGDYGFYLYNSSYNRVTNNVVVNFWGEGIWVGGGSHDNVLENNTTINTGQSLLPFLWFLLPLLGGVNPAVYLALGLAAAATVGAATILLVHRRGREKKVKGKSVKAVTPQAEPTERELTGAREREGEKPPATEKAPPEVRCPFCGSRIAAGQKICPKCGGVLL